MISRNKVSFRFSYILILISLMSVSVIAQDYKFKKLSKGLSDNNVTAIFEDSFHFMWIGTRNGLNRYDGTIIKTFEPIKGDSTSIGHGFINAIIEDENRDLWIATEGGGLSHFKRNSRTFETFNMDQNNPKALSNQYINHLFIDNEGMIWVATENGIEVFDPIKKEVINRYLEGEIINYMFFDQNGNTWAGGNNLFKSNNGSSFTALDLLNEGSPLDNRFIIGKIEEDIYGNMWFATITEGLFKLEKDQDSFINYRPEAGNDNSLGILDIRTTIADKSGNLWIGTENGGVDILNINSEKFTHYKRDDNNPDGINSNSIWSLFEDHIGRIWIGTFSTGLMILDPYSKAFTKITTKSTQKILGKAVHSIAKNTKGQLWIGMDGYGLDLFDTDQGSIAHYEHDPNNTNSLANNAVLKIVVTPEDNLLIGTWAGGLTLFDTRNKVFTHYTHDANNPKSISSNNVFAIEPDPSNDYGYWVGAWGGGLAYFDIRTKEFTQILQEVTDFETNIDKNIRVIEASNNEVWLGTFSGLNKIEKNGDLFTSKRYYNDANNLRTISQNAISSIQVTRIGTVWIGTENGGLNRYHPETDDFSSFTKVDGLPSNSIKSIEEDGSGNLWMGTSNGISKMEMEEDKTIFTNYDEGDGLHGNFFNSGSSVKSKSGLMYFGGNEGLTSFSPEMIIPNPNKPSIIFSDFKIFNKSIVINEKNKDIIDKHISMADQINLTHHHNTISIDYVALNYTRAEKNQYAYKLEGVDNDWNYVGNQTTATYSTLPPGTYTLRVIGSNNDDVWNMDGASIIINVAPAWWNTWWFRLIVLIVLSLIIGFIIKDRRDRNLRQKQELQKQLDEAVAEVRMRNAGLREQNENLNKSVLETNFVINEAVESGNYSGRINTSDKTGQWKDLGESINLMFESFVKPLTAINQIASAMANDDLSNKMDEQYKGDILSLSQNFNKALNNLNGLINQISESAFTIEESSEEMLETSEEMNRNTSEIASAISQMSNGAQTQVSTVDTSSVIVEEIREASEAMGRKSESINNVAKEGVEKSNSGMIMVNNVTESMNEISEYSQKTESSMKVLTERSNEISRVLGVISTIASQTNLLALNAAIEAAQAGDAGRGFAVVAEEIRKLAESSRASTKEIEQLVQDVQKDTKDAAEVIQSMGSSVQKGVNASNKAAKVFEEISNASKESLTFSEEILEATNEQTENINKVVATIENVVVIAEQTAAGTEEVAASANELVTGMDNYSAKSQSLNDIANVLKNAVKRFKLAQSTEAKDLKED
ncbi:MAG: methyl-accepting chemotaxis protein [Reichenbachiella sp.]